MTSRTNDAHVAFLLELLEVSSHAGVMLPWGRPGPIELPDNEAERRELALAHIQGRQATVVYAPANTVPKRMTVDPLVLFAYAPASDGKCRWIGIDLDSCDGHGSSGLVDAVRAAACIAGHCDAIGLLNGLVIARSRSGRGRHAWLVPPYPVSLDDAVIAVGGIAALGMELATRDENDRGLPHAFLCGNGSKAIPGRSGSVELIPHSTERPPRGWSLLLPCSGAFKNVDGGAIVDPFTSPSVHAELREVPCCPDEWWRTCISELRAEIEHRTPLSNKPNSPRPPANPRSAIQRVDPRTRVFLEGRCPPGERDRSLFIAVCNMIGVGMAVTEVESLALQGAAACGLPDREARATIRSALRTKGIDQ